MSLNPTKSGKRNVLMSIVNPVVIGVIGSFVFWGILEALNVFNDRPFLKYSIAAYVFFGLVILYVALNPGNSSSSDGDSRGETIVDEDDTTGGNNGTDEPTTPNTPPEFSTLPQFDGWTIKQRIHPTGTTRVDQVDMEIWREGEKVGTAFAVSIDNECSWAWGSSDSYVYRDGKTDCNLVERLRNPIFKDRIDKSFNIVFVGLDSSAGRKDRNSIQLTDDRAVQLAEQTAIAYPDFDRGLKRGWLAALGRYQTTGKPPRRNSSPEIRQRAAVIMGITTDKSFSEIQDIIRSILNRVEVGGIKFSNYEGIQNLVPPAIDLTTFNIRVEPSTSDPAD